MLFAVSSYHRYMQTCVHTYVQPYTGVSVGHPPSLWHQEGVAWLGKGQGSERFSVSSPSESKPARRATPAAEQAAPPELHGKEEEQQERRNEYVGPIACSPFSSPPLSSRRVGPGLVWSGLVWSDPVGRFPSPPLPSHPTLSAVRSRRHRCGRGRGPPACVVCGGPAGPGGLDEPATSLSAASLF